MVNWTEVIISLCTLIITGVIVPLVTAKWKIAKSEMSKETQETILYWTEVSVRWAKQWLASEPGEKKKAEVLQFVSSKLQELKINVSADELDKIIEAVYEQVKKEIKE
jgi:hypothetical protein